MTKAKKPKQQVIQSRTYRSKGGKDWSVTVSAGDPNLIALERWREDINAAYRRVFSDGRGMDPIFSRAIIGSLFSCAADIAMRMAGFKKDNAKQTKKGKRP